MDSILKNVKDVYIALFAVHVPTLFLDTYHKAPEPLK
jgi:hypothetical protein